MKTIAVVRKPIEKNVASNVLMHSCGGLNIDAARIKTTDFTIRTQHPQNNGGGMSEGEWKGGTTGSENGRWPANLILRHFDGCQQDGVKRVKGSFLNHECTDGNLYGKYASVRKRGHTDNDGKETVANWICEDGCPVKALDQQSGIVSTGAWVRPDKAHNFYLEKDEAPGKHEEWKSVKEPKSGASRYFKNIKDDLVSYLRVLITPPEGVVEVVPLDMLEPMGEDESVHGFIVMGTPTQEQANELLRICKPGAHVLLIAPEEQPTGHTGMCRLEDAGFEIRDTIMLLLEAGGFWYVSKPTKTEREAGTHNLAKKQQDVTRKEGHVGGDTPRNRGLKARGNSHPTVKPYAIMEALMKDAPKELPVVDPFMGSGSTGIAALHTGHDFIGIEREEDYMKIADARIRHWDQAAWRGHSVKIQSDAEQHTEADEDISLSDLFGSGG